MKKQFIVIPTMAFSLLMFGTVPTVQSHGMSRAALGFLSTPFGGRIITVTVCTCNDDPTDELISVLGPHGGDFMKTTTSRIYQYHNLTIGHWVLGIASGEKTCEVDAFLSCDTVGSGPEIKIAGTS